MTFISFCWLLDVRSDDWRESPSCNLIDYSYTILMLDGDSSLLSLNRLQSRRTRSIEVGFVRGSTTFTSGYIVVIYQPLLLIKHQVIWMPPHCHGMDNF